MYASLSLSPSGPRRGASGPRRGGYGARDDARSGAYGQRGNGQRGNGQGGNGQGGGYGSSSERSPSSYGRMADRYADNSPGTRYGNPLREPALLHNPHRTLWSRTRHVRVVHRDTSESQRRTSHSHTRAHGSTLWQGPLTVGLGMRGGDA